MNTRQKSFSRSGIFIGSEFYYVAGQTWKERAPTAWDRRCSNSRWKTLPFAGKRGILFPHTSSFVDAMFLFQGYLRLTKERPLKETWRCDRRGGSVSSSVGVKQIIRGGKGKKRGRVKCGLGQWFAIHAVSLKPQRKKPQLRPRACKPSKTHARNEVPSHKKHLRQLGIQRKKGRGPSNYRVWKRKHRVIRSRGAAVCLSGSFLPLSCPSPSPLPHTLHSFFPSFFLSFSLPPPSVWVGPHPPTGWRDWPFGLVTDET